MIGAFLGWQAAVLTFFLGPFFGLAHAAWKLLTYLRKWLAGGQLSSADREIPYGPYLSMAAAALFFAWPWSGGMGREALPAAVCDILVDAFGVNRLPGLTTGRTHVVASRPIRR